jgi:hypothetical protein
MNETALEWGQTRMGQDGHFRPDWQWEEWVRMPVGDGPKLEDGKHKGETDY